MTNNEIVEYIFYNRRSDIRNLIKRLIGSSAYDKSYEDLEQYIYISLLEMNNITLNKLYYHNNIMSWINRIVYNQRNRFSTNYNKQLRIWENNFNDIDVEYVDEMEGKMEIEEKIKLVNYMLMFKYTNNIFSGFTLQEKRDYSSLLLYRIYIKQKHTYTSLSKVLKIGRSAAFQTIKYAKYLIREEYKNNNR